MLDVCTKDVVLLCYFFKKHLVYFVFQWYNTLYQFTIQKLESL